MTTKGFAAQLLAALARDTPAFSELGQHISLRWSNGSTENRGSKFRYSGFSKKHNNISGNVPNKTHSRLRLLAVLVLVGALLGAALWQVVSFQAAGQEFLQPGEKVSRLTTGEIKEWAAPIANSSPAASTLAAIVAADQPKAETLIGYWTPQVMSQKVGLLLDGQVADYSSILEVVQRIKMKYPKSVIVLSDDYPSFRQSGFWVVLINEKYLTADEANQWCDRAGLSPDDCFANRLSHTDGPAGSAVYR